MEIVCRAHLQIESFAQEKRLFVPGLGANSAQILKTTLFYGYCLDVITWKIWKSYFEKSELWPIYGNMVWFGMVRFGFVLFGLVLNSMVHG